MTLTANTSTINVTGTGAFAGGNITTYNTINLNGTAHTVSGAFTCLTLRRTGTATKTDTVTFTSGTTVTCTNFAMIGNSATNRLLAQSSTLGTAATITATNQAFSNVDFMDITLTNAYDHTANLLTNAGFETGDPPTGWDKSAEATISSSATPSPPAGSKCGKLISGAGTWQRMSQAQSTFIKLIGMNLTLSTQIYIPSTNVRDDSFLQLWDGVTESNTDLAKNNAWATYTRTLTVGATANVVRVALHVTKGTLQADEVGYMDSTSLTITGTIGDCGGNTGIVFTPSATQTSSKASTWSDSTMWTSRVPLPQDDVSCSHNVTVDCPRIGKSVTFAGSPTVTISNDFSVYGSYTLASGMTYTNGGKIIYFRGRSSYTLTSAGKQLESVYLYAPTGTVTLQDNLTLGYRYRLSMGNLNHNNKNVTLYSVEVPSYAGTWTLGTGTLTLTNTDTYTPWSMAGVGAISLVSAGSTIILTNSGTNAQTFAGGGLTYNNVTVQGAGAYALTITGDNTFKTLINDSSVAVKTITGTAGSVQTIRNLLWFSSPSKVAVFNSTGAAWTVTGNSGYCEGDYVSLTNVVAGYPNMYFAGNHSTDGTGNTNWIFSNVTNRGAGNWVGRHR
jgi:hypothetical protein